MKVLITFMILFAAISANAQCTFPKQYNGIKVATVACLYGKPCVLLRGYGYVDISDSAGTNKVLSYEKIGDVKYAKLACGSFIPVAEGGNLISRSVSAENSKLGRGLSTSGRWFTSGAFFMFSGGMAAIISTIRSENQIKYDLTDPNNPITIPPNTSPSLRRFKTYFPIALTTFGSGLMIVGGIKMINVGKKAPLSSKLQLHYYGTSASLRLRF